MEEKQLVVHDKHTVYTLKCRGEYICRINWYHDKNRFKKVKHIEEIIQAKNFYVDPEDVKQVQKALKSNFDLDAEIIEIKVKTKFTYNY